MTQTGGHTGAANEDHAVLSIVAVQVKSQKSKTPIQTYTFLDPGSLGTFCTESVKKTEC